MTRANWFVLPLVALLVLLSGSACKRTSKPEEVRRQDSPSSENSAARAIGRGAYKASEETGKVLKKAGKELGEGIKEASQGWKEAQRESRAKKRKP